LQWDHFLGGTGMPFSIFILALSGEDSILAQISFQALQSRGLYTA
jgi:hypothetical protein